MPIHVCCTCQKVGCGCLGVSNKCLAPGCGYKMIQINSDSYKSSRKDKIILTFLMGTRDPGSSLHVLQNQHSILEMIGEKSIWVVTCPWECKTPVVCLTRESLDNMCEQNKLEYDTYKRDEHYDKWRRKLEYRCRRTGSPVYDDEAPYVGMSDFDSDAKSVSDWGDSDEDSDGEW